MSLLLIIVYLSSVLLLSWVGRRRLTMKSWGMLIQDFGNPPMMLMPKAPFHAGDIGQSSYLNYKHFIFDLRTSIKVRNFHQLFNRILIVLYVELLALNSVIYSAGLFWLLLLKMNHFFGVFI